jgi:hypothetical protein
MWSSHIAHKILAAFHICINDQDMSYKYFHQCNYRYTWRQVNKCSYELDDQGSIPSRDFLLAAMSRLALEPTQPTL